MTAMLAVVAMLLPRLAFAQPEDAVMMAAAPAPAVAYKAVSDKSNKKINMVISTLKDILQSVVNEEKEETVMFGKYTSWCDSETKSIAKDSDETRRELANSKVLNEEQVSTIDTLTLCINKNEKEMEDAKDAVAQAVALRTDENEKYTEEMQLNTQSLRQIELAIKHVGKVQKQGGFLQNGVLKKLAVNQPGESSYVLGVMKGLKDKLSKSRAEMLKVEKDKVTMHDSFMDTKGKTLKALGDSTVGKKIELAETTAKQAGTKRKIGKLTDSVASLEAAAAKTASSCMTTRNEWQVRQADRVKEKAALNEAVRFLTESSFEQLSMMQESIPDSDEEEHASVVFATSFLQTVADSKYSDNAFFAAAGAMLSGEDDENQVAEHTKKDTFNGVKSVVQKLIASHHDTQKEEKEKRDYCEKEIADKDDEKATTADNLAAVKANIEKKSSESVQLANEVKALYAAIKDTKVSLEKAGVIRKQEAALFKASSKDRALALKVLNQAKQVLQDFYDKANLMQRGSQAPKMPKSGRKKAASFGAVSMVQDIADDIAKEQKDAKAQEGEAASNYATLEEDSRTKTDDKQADITERVMAKAKLGVQINTVKETRTQMNDDLVAINKQLAALHQQCDELMQFYDKRVKARSFEVTQLKDVMDILSGSGIAPRLGLMDESAADSDSDSQE